jgi:hypothetical protein
MGILLFSISDNMMQTIVCETAFSVLHIRDFCLVLYVMDRADASCRNFRKSEAPIGKEMLVVYNKSVAASKMQQKGRHFEN